MFSSSSSLGLLLFSLPSTVFSGNCNYFENGPFGIGVIDTCGAQFESNVYFKGDCNSGSSSFPSFSTYSNNQCTQSLLPSSTSGGTCNNPSTGCKLYSLNLLFYPSSTDCGVTGSTSTISSSKIITDGAEDQCIEIPNDSRFSSWKISSTVDSNGYGFDTFDTTDCTGTVTNQYKYYTGCNLTPTGSSVYVTVELIDGGGYTPEVQTDCTETINVTDISTNGQDCSQLNFPCDDLEGLYYFNGYDSQGTPIYKHELENSYIDVFIDQLNGWTGNIYGTLASLGFGYNDQYYAPGWDHFADVEFVNQCSDTDLFQVEFGALEGATNIQYFGRINANTPPLFITAKLNDCVGIGLDIKQPTPMPTTAPTVPTLSPTPPTLSPSNAPTVPTVSSSSTYCPNYDDTIIDCNTDPDPNCADCQSWGCAACYSGYYKMGNFQRCQSCTDNYPGCSQCNDWQGCVLCETDKDLLYDATCADDICQ